MKQRHTRCMWPFCDDESRLFWSYCLEHEDAIRSDVRNQDVAPPYEVVRTADGKPEASIDEARIVLP